ncbi:hypothetical protein B566_EDAN001489 [Ephemera danica]|nr:hypothetical protein B566_EDAN001489 [Ephemera danica]
MFEDDSGKRWSCSVRDKNLEVLCVSQFTLYHELNGNKLDFHNAMAAEKAQEFYLEFLQELKKQYNPDNIKGTYLIDGKFGALMQVDIQNDGPVTVMIESPRTTNK